MTHLELIARLEKCEGPDREIDAEIDAFLRVGTQKMRETAPWAWKNFPKWGAIPKAKGMCGVLHDDGSHGLVWDSDPLTTSVDAALSLAERVLPGSWKERLNDALYIMSRKHHWHTCFASPEQLIQLPRQICIAILRAHGGSNADD